MAHALAARGLRAGDRLAVQLANRLEFLDLFLACLKLGAIFVPVNVLYREREVGHIVGRRGAGGRGDDAGPRGPRSRRHAGLGRGRARRRGRRRRGTVSREIPVGTRVRVCGVPRDRPRGPRDDTPAAIVYTSGTTGRAKGAVLTHGNLAANARTLVEAWRITAEDRYLAVLPLFHVHGLGNGVCSWLASGCRMRLVERFEHDKAEALFEEFRPTLFFGVPTMYVRLLELADAAAGGSAGGCGSSSPARRRCPPPSSRPSGRSSATRSSSATG